ncbi:unnamed protein product [Periconia digitata]|uniref:PLC-like phosphodiesterase n=1 Tax=Periconia digitata TaxID=1303443 RepID=A0A9W4USC4_9PLEO|nr:unnamed protein product [Periconia digitata]
MGYGGFLTLVNGSPNDWTVTSSPSYQMDQWKWPTVKANTAERVYVEWGTKGSQKDDAGEAYYKIGDKGEFAIRGKKPNDFMLTITLDNHATKQSPKGSKIDLGFRHDESVDWIMSTDEAGDWWSNSGDLTDWMQQSMGSIGNRTLKQICMPGSHDAGMSEFDPGTIGASFQNSQTQVLNIYDQLVAGSRYFDLRPVVSNGEWKAGHYSALGDKVWLGGNGLKISDVVKQVNDFTAKYKELVIINLSHTLDTDHDYKDLSQDQWNKLFDLLKGINKRYTLTSPGKTDLSNKVLDDFIGKDASVLIISQLPSGINLGSYADQGFYNQDNLPFYDSYAESNSIDKMRDDQLKKLKDERNLVADSSKRKDKFFVFSWTLTQAPEDVLNPEKAILNMATDAYDGLFVEAFNAFTPESFPNVLYIDAVGVRDKPIPFPYDKVKAVDKNYDIRSLAIAINNAKAGRNKYITEQK